eukprot:SAG11_NODE_8105_length_1059_cov_23.908333_1_plen_134_part_10
MTREGQHDERIRGTKLSMLWIFCLGFSIDAFFLPTLMKQNKLTPKKAHDIIEGKSKIHKTDGSVMTRHKLPAPTNTSGQQFNVKRGGDKAEEDMLLSDIMCTANSTQDDDTDEIYFVELRNRPDGSFLFCDASG